MVYTPHSMISDDIVGNMTCPSSASNQSMAVDHGPVTAPALQLLFREQQR